MLTRTGIVEQKSSLLPNGKVYISSNKSTTNKRAFEPSTFDDFDSENIDPAIFTSPSKKSKSDVSDKPFKPFTFSAPSKSMPPPPTVPSRLSTPVKPTMSSPRAPLTAPAGRSPKRKACGLGKGRRVSAPFSRIDPPFASRNTSSMPFSLDAALSGTFASSVPKDAGATIRGSMPKNWFFDIYEDTPEEVSATLMEHSTLTLDLSSDDESSKKEKDDRGKENTPPEGYDAPNASRLVAEPTVAVPEHVKKSELIRQKIVTDAMDDGQRSPLSDLETDPFIPEGLDKDSHIVVSPTPEKITSESAKLDMANLFATAVPFTSGSEKKTSTRTPSKSLYDMPVVSKDGEVKGDIIVWEDSPLSDKPRSPMLSSEKTPTSDKAATADKNTAPSVDEIA